MRDKKDINNVNDYENEYNDEYVNDNENGYEEEYVDGDGYADGYAEGYADGYEGEDAYEGGYADDGYEGADGYEGGYEGDGYEEEYAEGGYADEYESGHARSANKKKKPAWTKYVFNHHVLLLLIGVGIVTFIVFFIKGWFFKIDDDYINEHAVYTDGRDCYDDLHPLTDENGDLLANHNPHTILFFGNGAFAEDRDSENNVVNMIAKRTGSTVYNCAVEGSLLAAQTPSLKYTTSGLDVYNFYWLCLYLTWDEPLDYFDWLETQPEAKILPETRELRKTLETIDMSTVDTIAVMYDGSDYLASSRYQNDENPTDVMTFTGNLAAGLDVLQAKYPNIRIIVMSPTYAYGTDLDGNYVSSDVKEFNEYYGREALSTYMLSEGTVTGTRGITFIDNLYGTFNEDEAPEYLTDQIHLNQKGRELLATRFIGALTLYDEN